MSITGNKGEWSEIYTLFKILGNQSIHPGDKNLEKFDAIIYPVLKVLRSEKDKNFEYLIDKNIIIVSSAGKELLRLPALEFEKQSKYLLDKIKVNKKTFKIEKTEAFMRALHCKSLKASSSSKTDITIVIHDTKTNQTPTLGFSIKSQLGNPSTLLNAGRTTNFIFKICGINLSNEQIDSINGISTSSKIKNRLEEIHKLGGNLKFCSTERKIFTNNLVLRDSSLPHILAKMLYEFYTSNLSTTLDLTRTVEANNPLGFDQSDKHEYYFYKIKRFLTDVALGMMPSQVWTGTYDATGGYIVVKDDGNILCYHIYNKSEFEDYLLNNTKLDTASSTRHQFGQIYKEAEEYYINLNLQIRFIK